MAPELIRANDQKMYAKQIDVWSLGIVAYELAEGNPPYNDAPSTRIMFNIVQNEAPRIGDNWSADFRDFVAKCLDKDPETRWSAERLLEHSFLRGTE